MQNNTTLKSGSKTKGMQSTGNSNYMAKHIKCFSRVQISLKIVNN